MYKINQHFSNAVKKNGICLDKDLKYLKYEKLQKEPHGFYCKKWGNDFIIETNISDCEVVKNLILIAVSYITIYKKPFVIYY